MSVIYPWNKNVFEKRCIISRDIHYLHERCEYSSATCIHVTPSYRCRSPPLSNAHMYTPLHPPHTHYIKQQTRISLTVPVFAIRRFHLYRVVHLQK